MKTTYTKKKVRITYDHKRLFKQEIRNIERGIKRLKSEIKSERKVLKKWKKELKRGWFYE